MLRLQKRSQEEMAKIESAKHFGMSGTTALTLTVLK